MKEREKQLAKKEQSKELQLCVSAPPATGLPPSTAPGGPGPLPLHGWGGVRGKPAQKREVPRAGNQPWPMPWRPHTEHRWAALGSGRSLGVGPWGLMVPVPRQETGEAAREGAQEGGQAQDLQPVLHPGGRGGGG